MLEVLVSDIDWYALLSNREELLALASAIVGNQDVVLRNEGKDGSFPQDRYKAVTRDDIEQFILDNRNANIRTQNISN